MDVAYMGIVHVSRCSKEELAWAIDKQAHRRRKGGARGLKPPLTLLRGAKPPSKTEA